MPHKITTLCKMYKVKKNCYLTSKIEKKKVLKSNLVKYTQRNYVANIIFSRVKNLSTRKNDNYI